MSVLCFLPVETQSNGDRMGTVASVPGLYSTTQDCFPLCRFFASRTTELQTSVSIQILAHARSGTEEAPSVTLQFLWLELGIEYKEIRPRKKCTYWVSSLLMED